MHLVFLGILFRLYRTAAACQRKTPRLRAAGGVRQGKKASGLRIVRDIGERALVNARAALCADEPVIIVCVRDGAIRIEPDGHGRKHGAQQHPAEEAQVQHEQLPLVAAHERSALAQALPGRLLRMVEQQIQRLPVAVGRDDARHEQQQAPQEHKQPLQNGKPQRTEEDAEPVKEVADLGGFVPADMQRKDHKADADHIAHDLKRDDEHDRGGGHTVVLKEADVCLLDGLGAELRGVRQRRSQAVGAHQVRRERRDEQAQGKDDQRREDRARAIAGGAPAGVCFKRSTVQIHFDHNSVPGVAGSHFFIVIVYQMSPDLNTRSRKNSRFRHTLRFFR